MKIKLGKEAFCDSLEGAIGGWSKANKEKGVRERQGSEEDVGMLAAWSLAGGQCGDPWVISSKAVTGSTSLLPVVLGAARRMHVSLASGGSLSPHSPNPFPQILSAGLQCR